MKRAMLILALAGMLCGCAGKNNTTSKDYSATLQRAASDTETSKRSIDVSPLTTIVDTEFPSKQQTSATESNYNQSYTRLLITSVGADRDDKEKAEDAAYKKQSILKRFASANTCSVNLSAKVVIGSYQATIPLLTLTHGNDKDGEKWRQVVSHKLLNYPLFLINGDGRDSVPEIRLALTGDKVVNSTAAAQALGLAINALQVLSPEAKVLTTLTAQQTKDKATYIDNTINRLFSSGIAEEHVSHRDLRLLKDKGGFKVLLFLPEKGCKWDSDQQDNPEVGMWTIGFDEPRPSIFSNWRICDKENLRQMCTPSRQVALTKTRAELKNNPGKVLNFQISTGSTPELSSIRAYLVQKPWYIAAENAFGGKTGNDTITGEALCKNIFNEMTGLGLNGDDAGHVVWAVVTGMPHAQNIAGNAFKGTYCNTLVNNVPQ